MDAVTYVFKGLSKREKALRTKATEGDVKLPKKYAPRKRDKGPIKKRRAEKAAEYLATRADDRAKDLLEMDAARVIRGITFKKGEPVAVPYDKMAPIDAEELRSKLDAMVRVGVLAVQGAAAETPKETKPAK